MRARSSSKAGPVERWRINWTRISSAASGEFRWWAVPAAIFPMLVSFSISSMCWRQRTRSRMSEVTSRKHSGPGGFAKRQQAELDFERLAASGLAQGFHIEHRLAVLHAAHEFLQFGGFRGGDDGEAAHPDFLARVAVHAFGGSVPFQHAQAGIVEDDGAGEGFQQSAVALARAAQVVLAFSALAKHEPGRPEGQEQRRRPRRA